MHAAYRNGPPSLTSLHKDGTVSFLIVHLEGRQSFSFHFHFKIIYTQNPFSLQILNNKKVNNHIKYINIKLNLNLCTAT